MAQEVSSAARITAANLRVDAAVLGGVAFAAVLAVAVGLRRWFERRALERRRREALLPPGLPVGDPAPEFALRNLDGDHATLASLHDRGRPVVLFFTHPRCGPCHEILPSLARWQTSFAEELTIVIVSAGGLDANRELYETQGVTEVLLQQASEVYDAYAMRGTPSAVVVAPDGRIASATAEGGFPIEELVRLTLRRAAPVVQAAS